MMVWRTRPDALYRSVDFRNVVPWEPIEWGDDYGRIFRAPPFTSKSDLASTPPVIWWRLPPFSPSPSRNYAKPALAHDGGYQDWLENLSVSPSDDRLKQARELRQQAEALMAQAAALEAPCWTRAHLTKDESDKMLWDLMSANQVEERTKTEIYEGVHLLGWKAFREDRMHNA